MVVDANGGAVRPDLNKAAQQLNRTVNRNLWHAVLFHTTGELTRRALEAGGVGSYTPYADRQSLWAGPFRGLRDSVTRIWQYMDGKRPYESAIQVLVEATSS